MSRSILALPLLLLFSTLGRAGEADLQRCRAIGDSSARLACYDAIPVRDPDTRDAARSASPSAAAAPPAAAASQPPPAVSGASADFGLRQPSNRTAPESIRSEVPAGFNGWGPGSHIALANGQVWKVVDGTSGVVGRDIRQVTVKRGFMGAYYLRFDGMNKAPKVERVQ